MIPRLLLYLFACVRRIRAVYPDDLLAARRARFVEQLESKAALPARGEQPVADEQGHLEGERKAH